MKRARYLSPKTSLYVAAFGIQFFWCFFLKSWKLGRKIGSNRKKLEKFIRFPTKIEEWFEDSYERFCYISGVFRGFFHHNYLAFFWPEMDFFEFFPVWLHCFGPMFNIFIEQKILLWVRQHRGVLGNKYLYLFLKDNNNFFRTVRKVNKFLKYYGRK